MSSDRDSQFTLAPAASLNPLSASALRWQCDPSQFEFSSTANLEPIIGVIGQDTAVDALRFGLEIRAPGQNIFVRGLTGTGRMTLIRRLLEEIKPACPETRDRCYVHNFAHPDRPRMITLPLGRAQQFQRRMEALSDFIRDDLASALSSDKIQSRQSTIKEQSQGQVEAVLKPFQETLKEAGLGLVQLQFGQFSQAAIMPLMNGQPVSPEQWEQLRTEGEVSEEQYNELNDRRQQFEKQLEEVMTQVNEIRQKHNESMRTLMEGTVRTILKDWTCRIKKEFPETSVREFLEELVDDVAINHLVALDKNKDFTRLYRVNVLLTHDSPEHCPIIVENTPTISNLLGSVDHQSSKGEAPYSDHLMVRAGSLLRADGGYLIIEARDVLREPGAWKVLVRTLRTGTLEIVPPEMAYPWWIPSLKPEPIDLNIKVILLGDSETYYMLDAYDPDFPNLFKVLADFDSVIPNEKAGFKQYAGVIARIVREENLLHFDRSAIAALIERGARIAHSQAKLTTRFGRLADIAREAAFIAKKNGGSEVSSPNVQEAIRRAKERANLPSKRFRELLSDGTIRVSVKGKAVGQVNGIAVTQAGPMTYGFPARITATIGPGTAGVINIEREAQLSGALHTKGFYILGGLMRSLLRTEHPLAFDASVAFEQSYGGIDGDSASAAEICCLLSALTDISLRQDLAMTGAIDQRGNILAVGAVNEKIEGFFDVCSDIDLTGTQGVIIPQANARDLMLREDVVQACREKRFHVYPVDRVQHALEILTAVAAGERGDDGAYPENSLLGVAVDRAMEYWMKATRNIEAALAQQAQQDDEDAAPESSQKRSPPSEQE